MNGVCGNRRDGAFSIALAGLYHDNEDGGDIMYGYFPVVLIRI